MNSKPTPHASEIEAFDSDHYDTEAMHLDDRHGNFSPDRAEEYRHETTVAASLANGQFTQAREQCARFGLDYQQQRAIAFGQPAPGEMNPFSQ